ncbi:MAG: outer membrane lipoprotein carrier protein LolA [Rhodospirillaceae bacterium]|nr:outer membrane lipoprotein carrier protein LolA [Rhodospirillaceae bacterium]MBT5666393.1 outer membrane lipoprotein carrier protein LolA [Rhodospirillaceae bacterium]MBT5809840.1 outer membrane lipoprotein carrier protein LolA [Rhodospirillaceae bacterium]
MQPTMWASGKFWSATTAPNLLKRITPGLGAFFLFLFLTTFGFPALSASSPTYPPKIKRIEAYLNSITTLQSRFLQENPDGSVSEGILYLDRPGNLRFEYDPPDPYLIMVKEKWLIFVDKELPQTTYIAVEKTPAYFLTQEIVDFSKGLEITRFEHRDGAFRLDIQQNAEDNAGSVTLIFSDKPLTLRKWRSYGVDGGITDTTLINPEFGASLDGAIFEFEEPRGEGAN